MTGLGRESIGKIDLPYVQRDLPLSFLGLKHSRWTKKQLVDILEALGSTPPRITTKLQLYETVHLHYNSRRISQRTINFLAEIAQAAAGQKQSLQEQVREAVQDATKERASLARAKRAAAKPKGVAKAVYEPAPMQRAEKRHVRYDPELQREEGLDEYDDAEQELDQPQRFQFAAPSRSKDRRKRKAASDVDNISDGGGIGLLQQTVPADDVRDPDAGREAKRKRGRLASGDDRFKRRKANPRTEVGVEPPRPSPIPLGTSTAIRDNSAFRVGLQPIGDGWLSEQSFCQVCSDDMDPLLQFQVSVGSQCRHAPEICLACWEQHIASQAETKNWDSITCPHADCGVILGYGDMQRFAPAEIFRRYDKFQTNKALQNVLVYRLCAHEGCGSGGFMEDEEIPAYMTCADCQRHTCLGCNLIYHHGQTCDEYRSWLEDAQRRAETDEVEKARIQEQQRAEKDSAGYLLEWAKKCPNEACGAQIQKTTGCDHMTCRLCHHQFCWLCLAEYAPILREGNHRHAPECRYHFGGIPGH